MGRAIYLVLSVLFSAHIIVVASNLDEEICSEKESPRRKMGSSYFTDNALLRRAALTRLCVIIRITKRTGGPVIIVSSRKFLCYSHCFYCYAVLTKHSVA